MFAGLLTKILNNRIVVPLGRLSYSVFLVNLIVMLMSQSSQRLPIYPSIKSLVRRTSHSNISSRFRRFEIISFKSVFSVKRSTPFVSNYCLFYFFQVDAWIYDTFKSYLMGLMLYLIVEAPFGNLIKLLFGRG